MADIAPMHASEIADVLPLIAEYQRFYRVEPDGARNAGFFRRFVESERDGKLLGARAADGSLIGYACLHWRLDSVEAREVVCLHDLYVVPEQRGAGVGRALLEVAVDVARRRGAPSLVWSTAPDNTTAQRLYDATGATRSEWVEYDLPV